LAFLDASEEVIGSPVMLDLRTVQMNDNTWREHSLEGTAPEGTAFARVSGIMIDGVNNVNAGGTLGGQSAFFDDFSLALATDGLEGDFNEDGIVNIADYTTWRDNLGSSVALPNDGGLGTPVSAAHYDLWKGNFGETSSGNLLTFSATVPEPTTCIFAAIACAGLIHLRRRH
jgi:hypothetical protein